MKGCTHYYNNLVNIGCRTISCHIYGRLLYNFTSDKDAYIGARLIAEDGYRFSERAKILPLRVVFYLDRVAPAWCDGVEWIGSPGATTAGGGIDDDKRIGTCIGENKVVTCN